MKKFLIATTALTLMCGVASAQTNQGAASSNSGPAKMEKHKFGAGTQNRMRTGSSRGSTYPGPSKNDRNLPPGSQSVAPDSPNVRNSR